MAGPGTNAIICKPISTLEHHSHLYETHIIARKTKTSLSASSLNEFRHHERCEEQNGNERAGECNLCVDVLRALGTLGELRDPLAVAHLSPLLVAGDGSILKEIDSADCTIAS